MSRRMFLLAMIGGASWLSAAGCSWGERRGEVVEFDALPGLSICEVEDIFLNIKGNSDNSAGFHLFVNQQEVADARLRIGGQFVLSKGRDYAEWYRVLLLEPDRITLKRSEVRETVEESGTRKRLRTVEKVIVVKPYNLEKPR